MSEHLYTVYGGATNRALRVMWCLEELDLNYDMVDLNLFGGEQRNESYLKLNPAGKVPTLIDHTTHDALGQPLVLTESVAILNYLAEKHADHPQPLLPKTLAEKAYYHQWMSFGATELEPPAWVYAKQTFIYPEPRRITAIKPTCAFELQRAVKHLALGLEDGRAFVLGDHVSAADIFIGQTMMWAELQGIELPQGKALAYLTRLKERPALKRALARGK